VSEVRVAAPGAAAGHVEAAVALAEELLERSQGDTTRSERRRARRLGRLLADPGGRELLFALTDEVVRIARPARSVARLRALVAAGLPASLGPVDRAGLKLAAATGRWWPGGVARVVDARIRRETAGVILAAEDPALARHLARRRREGLRVNVNRLGEAILGDGEADRRRDAVAELLQRDDVEYVSVKISALCANLDVLAFEHSVEHVAAQLRPLYRLARDASPPKFVNLDMEEYRDLRLTVAAFRRVLDEPEFVGFTAGIVLQAYLPDSHGVLDELATWAADRVASGGAPIKVRLVKGANLAMERVEAELAGWPLATYSTKAEADASLKRLLAAALDSPARRDGGMRIGVGSHNLFDVGWALVERDAIGARGELELEMIEGMAPAQSRAARAAAGGLLLYAPVVARADFEASIAYLARRLDENSGPENFLRALFTLQPGSPELAGQAERFRRSVAEMGTVATTPRRTQDRANEAPAFAADAPFANVADTDFTVPSNRAWITAHLAEDRPDARPSLVTTTDGIDAAVARARRGATAWAATTTGERRAVLSRAVEVMARQRGRTMAVMAHETAKTVREADPEVSEAIDAVRYGGAATRTLEGLVADGLRWEPHGVVLVAGPWNFPYAIPAIGVSTALAAGNAVMLKPAPESVATAVELVRHLHEGGVPADVLQLVTCPDDDVGRHLVTHDDVDAVILTGSYDTAAMFLDWKPSLVLRAETSGKNALVITEAADLDLAIRDLVRSAFGHAGQKCSAASLAIVEAAVYDDARFHERLADAVRSLRVGPATDVASMVAPLIRPPADPLARALTALDPGERWLVEPRRLSDDGRCWSPGVKRDVAPGSWFHRTECFGPVLGLLRADDLDHALELQNGTDYGLTGGLHSLDPAEIDHWLGRVEVGNAYVNRPITGAIVARQPFGGWKRSSVGGGAKAGGPGYILGFGRAHAAGPVAVDPAQASYRLWWSERYGEAIDVTGLRSEGNELRYRPLSGVVVRLARPVTDGEVQLLRAASELCGTSVLWSVAHGLDAPAGAAVEDEVTLGARLAATGAERLRLVGPATDDLRRASHRAGLAVDETPLSGHGLVELTRWLKEQAISRTLHRHGRVATTHPPARRSRKDAR
jgi:RHH-type proline utilization regulon transcriptional repressor/proline dehydrogenase/delta 1-pyrroline-5-carboxylate dehydrogenase